MQTPEDCVDGRSFPSHKAREFLLAAGASFLVSLAIVSPFWRLSNASGHDISFHAASWIEAANQWRQGTLFPRWAEWANFGFGEPRFIFYPPLSWLLGAAFVSILPIKMVAGAFIVFVQTLAGVSAYALTRRFASFGGALCGSILFTANPYALLIIYVRSDYAELLALGVLPLVLLHALRLCDWLPGKAGPASRGIAFFALSFATVWLSNAPAAVVTSYSVAFLFAWAAAAEKSWEPVRNGASGIVLGMAIVSFYLIPAAYEQRWVNIADALSAGLTPAENFLFTRINDADHNHFNRIASWVAVLLLVLTMVFATLLWRKRGGSFDRKTVKTVAALILLATVAGLLMESISQPLWNVLPKLRFVQFPWRWMSVVSVILSVFAAGTLSGSRRAWMALTVLLLGFVNLSVYLGKNTWWDGDDFPSLQYDVQREFGYEGTDEYDPVGDDHTDLKEKQRAASLEGSHGRVFVERWTAERRVVNVEADEADRLSLRLVDYPAWKFFVNGEPLSPEHLDKVKAVAIPLKAGKSKIEAQFTRTEDRTIGGAVSLLALALLGFLFALEKRKRFD